MRILYILACVIFTSASAWAGIGSASFEVWSEDPSLHKLSSVSTDSVDLVLQGNTAIIRCEVRETYNGRPTRRLQITLAQFNGVGQYSVNSNSTFWENFSTTKKCDCFNAVINAVKVTEYDSVKKSIKGTFEFKCLSLASSGDQLTYRIRSGLFESGEPKIRLENTPKDTVKLPLVQADTVIGISIHAFDPQNAALQGATVFVKDAFVSNAPTFTAAGTTNSNGLVMYTTTISSSTPSGEYTIQLCASKAGMKGSDTVTVLYRYGKRYYDYVCGGISILRFDAGEGKEWKTTSGSPLIKADGPVTVGGILKMEGITKIDTTPGAIRIFAGGKAHIPDVHFLDGTEDFLLYSDADADFPLPDCNGILKLASKKLLTKKLPGGIQMTLTEFSFIDRADAKGLNLKIELQMANSRVGCTIRDSAGATTGGDSVKLSAGVGITTAGFENFSVAASNLSLTPAFCLKDFAASADFVNKQYYLGGKIEFPVKTNRLALGGGALFKNNLSNPDGSIHLDSIQLSLEVAECKPIPDTPLCFKGLALSASGLSGATWQGATFRGTLSLASDEQVILSNPKFSWLKNLLGNPALAEFDGTIQYQHPLIFTGSITSRLAKVSFISAAKPWQIEGTHTATIDLNSSVTLSGNYKAGHLGADDYTFTASGSMGVQWTPTLGVSALGTGAIRIPGVGDDVIDKHPYAAGFLRFLNLSGLLPTNIGSGTASISVTDVDGFKLEASADVSRNPIDYIRSFGRMNLKLAYNNGFSFNATSAPVPPSRTLHQDISIQGVKVNTPNLQAVALDTIPVDAGIERLFILISGKTKAPASTLTDPSGTVFTAADSAVGVLRFATPGNEMVQWTIVNPKVGGWQLALTSPNVEDSVFYSANRKPIQRTVNLQQNLSTLNITWDGKTGNTQDQMRFYLSDDTMHTSGILIGSAALEDGKKSIVLPSTLQECVYHLYYVCNAEGLPIDVAFVSGVVRGNGTAIPAPQNVSAQSTSRGDCMVRWNLVNDKSVQGYSVHVVDASGRDSLYALVFGDIDHAQLTIANPVGSSIYIYAFDNNAARSCKSQAMSIVVSVDDESAFVAGFNSAIEVVPHPAKDISLIRVHSSEMLGSTIEVFSLDGRLVSQLKAQPDYRNILEAKWDCSSIPEGLYLIRIQTTSGVIVSKAVVVH